jgi:acyl-CoA synthetase (AMP-forming)/AMP-acid ligase II
VIANLGIFKAGGSMFLIETNFTPQLIADFLLDCNLAVVLTFAEMKGNLPKESAQGTPYMVVEMDGTGWVTEAEADLALPILSPHGLSPTDPAYHTMTSGTTGKPKAVINSHYGSVICFVGRNDLYPYLPEEREGLNMFFAWECVRAVMFGSTSVIIPDSLIFDPPKLMRYVVKGNHERKSH